MSVWRHEAGSANPGICYDELNMLAHFHPTVGLGSHINPWQAVSRAAARWQEDLIFSSGLYSFLSQLHPLLFQERLDVVGVKRADFSLWLCVYLTWDIAVNSRPSWQELKFETLGTKGCLPSNLCFKTWGGYHLTHSTCTFNGSTKIDT